MVWIQVWLLHVTTFLLISGDDDVPFAQLQRRKVRPHSSSLTSHLTSGEEYLDEASPPTSQVPRSISSEEDIREEPPPLHSSKLKLFLTFPSSKSSGSSGTEGPLLVSVRKPSNALYAPSSSEGFKKPRGTRRKRITSLPRDRSSRGSSSQGVAGTGLSGDASAGHPLLSSEQGRRVKRAAYKSFKETRQRGKAEGMYSLLLPDDRTQTVSYYADENGYFPTITYDGGHQFSYYFEYPHEANKHPNGHLQIGVDGYKNHPATVGDHDVSRVGRLGEVALSIPSIHPLRPIILKSVAQNIADHSYTSLPVSKYQAPLTTKSQSSQHSAALLKSQGATRHPYKGEIKSNFSVKRLPLVVEQKRFVPGKSDQHSSDRSGYYYDHPSMKSAPSYAKKTYATTQPHVPPSELYGYPPPPKYNTDSKVPVLGSAKPTAHELRKPTAHALSDHYGVPHQTRYSSQTISPKPSYHASSLAVKGLPHLAPHPARESVLKTLDRGLLVASRMLEEGEDLSVYIASVDSADSGYSEHSLTADDLMALTNFDVTKTLFRPPNILTGHPFFRPPRTLRRLITTEDYLVS